MTKWNQHGMYTFEREYLDEQIIFSRISGVWNLETAEVFVSEYYELAKRISNGKSWGCINDFRQWGLCTPDVTEYFNSKVTDFIKINNRWQAVLPTTLLQQKVVRDYTDAAKQELVTQYFDDENDALLWIRSEYLKHRNS